MFCLFKSSSLAWPRHLLSYTVVCHFSHSILHLSFSSHRCQVCIKGVFPVYSFSLSLCSSDISPNKTLAHLNWSWCSLFGGSKLTHINALFLICNMKGIGVDFCIPDSSTISPIFEILEGYPFDQRWERGLSILISHPQLLGPLILTMFDFCHFKEPSYW